MKRIISLLIISALVLTIFSCSTTDPDPPIDFEKFLERFATHVEEGILFNNVASIMTYYSDTYLNNSMDKTDMEDFYASLADASPDSVSMEIDILSEEDLKVSYQIVTAGVDTTFIDYAQAQSDSFLFLGDQNGPEPPTPFEEFLDRFATHVEEGIPSNIASIMTYYSDTYLNDGMDKTDMEDFYASLANASRDKIMVDIDIDILSEEDLKISYQIVVIDTIAVDTTFIDYAQAQSDSFLFIGDQKLGIQKVLVEVCTGTACENCPYAENAAKDLKETYGDQIYYVEYHWRDKLDPLEMNKEFFDYFGVTEIPQGIFQGQVKVIGGGTGSYNEYVNALSGFLEQEALAILEDFSYTVSDSLYGSVTVKKANALPLENLYLKYLLVEKESDVLNYWDEPCLQAVLGYSKILISDHDFSQPVEFALTIPHGVPDDTVLYIWLQTFEDTYNQDTCKIYNVLEEDVSFDKKSVQ